MTFSVFLTILGLDSVGQQLQELPRCNLKPTPVVERVERPKKKQITPEFCGKFNEQRSLHKEVCVGDCKTGSSPQLFTRIFKFMWRSRGFPRDTRDLGSIPGLGRSPGEGKWQPTPVLLPEKCHG